MGALDFLHENIVTKKLNLAFILEGKKVAILVSLIWNNWTSYVYVYLKVRLESI